MGRGRRKPHPIRPVNPPAHHPDPHLGEGLIVLPCLPRGDGLHADAPVARKRDGNVQRPRRKGRQNHSHRQQQRAHGIDACQRLGGEEQPQDAAGGGGRVGWGVRAVLLPGAATHPPTHRRDSHGSRLPSATRVSTADWRDQGAGGGEGGGAAANVGAPPPPLAASSILASAEAPMVFYLRAGAGGGSGGRGGGLEAAERPDAVPGRRVGELAAQIVSRTAGRQSWAPVRPVTGMGEGCKRAGRAGGRQGREFRRAGAITAQHASSCHCRTRACHSGARQCWWAAGGRWVPGPSRCATRAPARSPAPHAPPRCTGAPAPAQHHYHHQQQQQQPPKR